MRRNFAKIRNFVEIYYDFTEISIKLRQIFDKIFVVLWWSEKIL